MKKLAMFVVVMALLVCSASNIFARPRFQWIYRVWYTPGCSSIPGTNCAYKITWDDEIVNCLVLPSDVNIDYSTSICISGNTYMALPVNNEPEQDEFIEGYIIYTTSGN
jgi:hypothetical protein